MDGDIYYCDMFFLVWISKHKRKELHAAHDSFLFMGVCITPMEDLFMDPCIILLSIHGKNLVFEFIYLHILTISMQCISPQEGKFFILLHGQHWAKLYDGDIHLLCGLGQVFYHCMYVHFMCPTIY